MLSDKCQGAEIKACEEYWEVVNRRIKADSWIKAVQERTLQNGGLVKISENFCVQGHTTQITVNHTTTNKIIQV